MIVVRRREGIPRSRQRGRNVPLRGQIGERDFHGRVAALDRIHKYLCQVEKCMLRIQLRAEGAGLISEDLVADFRALRGSAEVPRRLIHLAHRKRLSIAGSGPDPVHVLGEIAHLIKGVPDRQLQIAFGCAGTEEQSSLPPGGQAGWPTKRRIAPGRATRTGILCSRRHRHQHGEAENNKSEARSGRETHALADAFSEWLPEAPPAIDFRRCGSFS